MKLGNRKLFIESAMVGGLVVMIAGLAQGQSFKALHSFTATPIGTNSDGAVPQSGLVLSGTTLFGTAATGGTYSNGTVFAVNIDGTGFKTLYNFTTFSGTLTTNSDGANPFAALLLSGDTLYGTTSLGGPHGGGTVFALGTNGAGFRTLYSFSAAPAPGFTNTDGVGPTSRLVLSGDTLFGTAKGGGTSGEGTIFAIKTNGTGFANLHNFSAFYNNDVYEAPTNWDGAILWSGLVLYSNTLFGTTAWGGSFGSGTIFVLNTDGTAFRTLHSFAPALWTNGGTNSDGAFPTGDLLLSGNTLYGTTQYGGSFSEGGPRGCGTVFRVSTDGTAFTNLHSFSGNDGMFSKSGLVLSDNTLYGTTWTGLGLLVGTIFAVTTDGTAFQVLHSFTGQDLNTYTNTDGFNPHAGLVLSRNTLYGTASGGGPSNNGIVFSVIIQPQLTLTPSASNLILTWATNAQGFALQSTTDLGSSSVWSTNLPPPVVVNGQNFVTNPISGKQQFFRLSQ